MKHPTKEECERLLNEYNTPPHVRRHCRAVADTAVAVAEALNEKGFDLDIELVMAAGMLHDIARVEDKHWEVGADLMDSMGYMAEGRIIRAHMTHRFSGIDDIDETDMVCLGDRLVREDEYVGLDKRMQYVIDKAKRGGHPEAEAIIREKKKESQAFLDDIADVIGMTIDELMRRREISRKKTDEDRQGTA